MCFKDTHQIWGRSAKFFFKSKSFSRSGSGSCFYFGFQYQTYISYIDPHQILFGLANSFGSYCVHSESPRTYVQPDIQIDRWKFFFAPFWLLRHTKHEHSSKRENFFFTHAITILALFTYSVCDEKVKIADKQFFKKYSTFVKKVFSFLSNYIEGRSVITLLCVHYCSSVSCVSMKKNHLHCTEPRNASERTLQGIKFCRIRWRIHHPVIFTDEFYLLNIIKRIHSILNSLRLRKFIALFLTKNVIFKKKNTFRSKSKIISPRRTNILFGMDGNDIFFFS